MSYHLVYPDGDTAERDGEVPTIGYDVDGYRVDFVRRRGERTTVFLGLHYGQSAVVKLITLTIAGVAHNITVAEAAELAERARTMSMGTIEGPLTALAIQLEHLVEEAAGTQGADIFKSEWQWLRAVIAQWRGEADLPARVHHLDRAVEYFEEGETEGVV
jgi:hypothetical protein